MPWWPLMKELAYWAAGMYASYYIGKARTKQRFQSQKTISSSSANPPPPPRTLSPQPTKAEPTPFCRNPHSSKAILDNVFSNPFVPTINTSLDCRRTPGYGSPLLGLGLDHWILCVAVALLCLNWKYKWFARWLAQEKRHHRARLQMQQDYTDQMVSKDQAFKTKIAELELMHRQAFDELKQKRDQEINGKEVSSIRDIEELKANHGQIVNELEVDRHRDTAGYRQDIQGLKVKAEEEKEALRHKQRVVLGEHSRRRQKLKDAFEGEIQRLGQLPEKATEQMKDDQEAEIQRLKQHYEQELSMKNAELESAKEDYKNDVEAKDEEIKQEVNKVKAAETKLDTVATEKEHRINGLEEELQQSAVTIQDCRTTALENATVINSQQHEILGLKSTIETYDVEKANAGRQIHCLKLKEIRQKREIDNLETKCKSRLPKIQALEGDVQQKDVQIADLIKDRDFFKNDSDNLSAKCKRRDTKIRALEGEARQKDVEIAELKAEHESSEQKKDEDISKLTADCENWNIRYKSVKEAEQEADQALADADDQHAEEIKALKTEMEEQQKNHETTLADLKRNTRPSSNGASPRNGGSQRRNPTTTRNTNPTVSRSSPSQVVSQKEIAVQPPAQKDAVAPESTVQPTTIPQPTVGVPQQQQTAPAPADDGASLATTPVQARLAGPRHQQNASNFLPRQLQVKQQTKAQQARTPTGTSDGASRSVVGQQSINNDSHIDQEEKELRREQEKPFARRSFEKTTQHGPSTSTRIGQGINKNNDTESKNEVQSATPKQLPSPSFLDSVLQSRITVPCVTQTQNETRVAEEKKIEKTKQEEEAATQLPVQESVEQTFEDFIDQALLDDALGPIEQSSDQHVEKKPVEEPIEKPVKQSSQGFSAALHQEMQRKKQRKVHFNNGGAEDDYETPGDVDEPKQTMTESYTAQEKGRGKIGKEEPAVKKPVEKTPNELIDPELRAQDSSEKPDEEPVEEPKLYHIPKGYNDSLVEEERRRGRNQTVHENRDGSIEDEDTKDEPVKNTANGEDTAPVTPAPAQGTIEQWRERTHVEDRVETYDAAKFGGQKRKLMKMKSRKGR